MTTKTKVYLALIATGLVALAVDRLYIGASSPATTKANEINAPSNEEDSKNSPSPPLPARANSGGMRPGPVPQPQPANPSKLSVPELHFPRNLPVYDPASEMRDVFLRAEVEDSMTESDPHGRHESARKKSADDTIGREAFHAAHRIDAVMTQESLKIAVVNGRWLRIGDAIDQCMLIRIEGDAAIFQCHDGDTVLTPSGKRLRPSD